MSKNDPEIAVPHPRETTALFGHHDAEQTLLTAYRGGRIPHAWLISGPQGIGKATLAYRMARFVLAHRDPASSQVQSAETLDLDADHPVSRQVASESHGGLLSIRRTPNDKGVMRTVITVDDVRETVGFYGSTAAEFLPANATSSDAQPRLPASGGPGGNPALWDVLYTVNASVTNTGTVAGDEVPQLYVSLGGPKDPKVVLRKYVRISPPCLIRLADFFLFL